MIIGSTLPIFSATTPSAAQADSIAGGALGRGLLFSQGRTDEAVTHYEAAVRLNPTGSQNRYALGQGYLTQKRYDEAAEQFKEVIHRQPKDSGGYYALGQTYRAAGNWMKLKTSSIKPWRLKATSPMFTMNSACSTQSKSK